MLRVKVEEPAITSNDRRFFCVNQSVNRFQHQNKVSVFITAVSFFGSFMVTVDFIQSVKISSCHSTFPPLGGE